jgi:Helix-turn-helix domain
MDHIAHRVSAIARNIEIVGADPVTLHGFTQVPNVILKSEKLSAGAKLSYAMLLHYAWQNDYCFPGQERLAVDMGAGKRSIIRFMAELETEGYIAVQRRGLGKTNLYKLFVNPTKDYRKTKQRHMA